MVAQKRFPAGKTPFIRRADSTLSTTRIMWEFLISLLPLVIFAWVKNGIMPFAKGDTGVFGMLYPLVFLLVGGVTGYIVEGLYFMIFKKEVSLDKLNESFSLIPGLLLAMILPLNTPIWVLILGVVFAILVGKMVFGGFGHNIFNPALIGYIFVMTAYYGVILNKGGYANGSEIEVLAGATPLTTFFSGATLAESIAAYGNLGNFFFGFHAGSIAETSAFLCLLSFVYLSVRKIINWRIPVVYIGTVFVLTYIIGATQGYAADLRYPLFQILNGGLFFGAVFMATEPVTSPRTPNGKVIFALFLAAITVMLRFTSDMPEGVATSILFMNMFVPLIDKSMAKIRINGLNKKAYISYGLMAIAILAIFGFTLLQIGV